LNLPPTPLVPKNVNHSKPSDWKAEYTDELIACVAEGCAKDIERFGYTAP